MRANELHRNAVIDLRTETGRALARSGAWLIAAYVGASAVAIGVLHLIQNEGNPLPALLLVFAGGAWADVAWRSAYRAIDRVDAVTTGPAYARKAAERNTSGLTTLIGAPEA
jgi:hypothetical protein